MDCHLKVALITGAGSGFGAGTAVHLAGKGYRLALNDLRSDRLAVVKTSCMEAGLSSSDVIVQPGDVRHADVANKTVQDAVNRWGRLDLLVNSAGILISNNTLSATMEEYDLTMDVNARAVVMWCREAVPHLIKTKGNIVNLCSIDSVCARERCSFYCMSKAAVNMFTRCLANELGPKGVRVNCVNPGIIATNIYEKSGETEEHYLKRVSAWEDVVPLKMSGSVQDVVLAIDFLASEKARFITGESINVDGGAVNKIEEP